jgi:hypothetical protein
MDGSRPHHPTMAILTSRRLLRYSQIDIAWDLLMQDTFRDLRQAICATDYELKSFRQIVVNAVMATE